MSQVYQPVMLIELPESEVNKEPNNEALIEA
jgi:hypothetical protein